MIYTALWAAVGLGLLFALFIRPEIEMTVAALRNPTFIVLSDGAVRNVYDIRLRNKQGTEQTYALSLSNADQITLSVEGAALSRVTVAADQTLAARVYLTAPAGSDAAAADRTDVRLWVENTDTGERASQDNTFNGRGG